MQQYGIRGHSLDWFKNYLNDRKQFTHVNHTNSDYHSISCGVPKGSLLGSLLFTNK